MVSEFFKIAVSINQNRRPRSGLAAWLLLAAFGIGREGELTSLIEEQHRKLEQISGLTVEQAKQELIRGIENEAKIDQPSR